LIPPANVIFGALRVGVHHRRRAPPAAPRRCRPPARCGFTPHAREGLDWPADHSRRSSMTP